MIVICIVALRIIASSRILKDAADAENTRK